MPKTHPPLLLRDALAGVFVSAVRDADPAALAALDALARWSPERPLEPALAGLVDEHGEPLFGPAGPLGGRFAALEAYVSDRARRFSAACSWLRDDGGLGDALEAARAAWDAGLFFEVHEILEPVWLRASGAEKTALQGLIMAGAALHHLTQDNPAGAAGLLREAARRLREVDPGWPLALVPFAAGLAALAAAIAAGQVQTIADVTDLPALEQLQGEPRAGR